MSNLQENKTNNQPTVTFNFESLADATPDFFRQARNLDDAETAESFFNNLCFEIAGKCDQWAIVALMLIFNSILKNKYPEHRAELFQTACFRWTNEAAAAETAFIDSLRGNQTQAEPNAPSQPEPLNFQAETLENADAETLSIALSEILNNPNLPPRIYDNIADGVMETYNDIEYKNAVNDSPEYIAKILTVYNETQREADETERAELLEKHRKEAAEHFARIDAPLDLSEMSADQLGTNDKLKEVARCLSGILQDASLPELLRTGVKGLIVDELFNNSNNHAHTEQIEESTEYIEAVLKNLEQ